MERPAVPWNDGDAMPRGGKTAGLRPERRTAARLTHEQAAEMLVDFELGRLSPRRSAAVEQHVRSCDICQKQGLGHAATERRQIIKKLDRVRPSRRMLSRRARGIILILVVALIFELIVFEFLNSDSTLHQILGSAVMLIAR